MKDCLFCRIARGEIPARKLYEDDVMVAFHDIHPQRPVHFLVIPKVHISGLDDVAPNQEPMLGRMLGKLSDLARSQGLEEGFRTIINTGRIGGQEVYHLHVHVLGGPEPVGPMVRSLS